MALAINATYDYLPSQSELEALTTGSGNGSVTSSEPSGNGAQVLATLVDHGGGTRVVPEVIESGADFSSYSGITLTFETPSSDITSADLWVETGAGYDLFTTGSTSISANTPVQLTLDFTTLSVTNTNDVQACGLDLYGPSGGPYSGVAFSVNVDAVEPINSVPGCQTVEENASGGLVFSSANSNLISISDVDSDTSNVQETLSVSNGTLTLVTGLGGITFVDSTSNGEATLSFTGSVSAINTALAGLTYQPTTNYNGSDTLNITTADLDDGLSSTTDAIDIAVTVPMVVNVASSTADGTYTTGDEVTITVTFNEVVTVTGTPQITLAGVCVPGVQPEQKFLF